MLRSTCPSKAGVYAAGKSALRQLGLELTSAFLIREGPAKQTTYVLMPMKEIGRSGSEEARVGMATCLEADDSLDTTFSDVSAPAAGTAYFYLVRAENGCGPGPLGVSSDNQVQSGRSCP